MGTTRQFADGVKKEKNNNNKKYNIRLSRNDSWGCNRAKPRPSSSGRQKSAEYRQKIDTKKSTYS